MDLSTQYKIRSNPNYIKFLREKDIWYKYLNRNPVFFKDFDKDMRTTYKLTSKDKLDRLSKNIDKVSQIIDIFS